MQDEYKDTFVPAGHSAKYNSNQVQDIFNENLNWINLIYQPWATVYLSTGSESSIA